MRLLIVALVASCAKSPPPTRPAATPANNWKTTITPLEVIVLDDFRTHASCDGIAPRRFDVQLDGKPVTSISVPCSTTVRAPPQQFAAPAFDVAPGKHVIRVHEVASGREATAELEFPVSDPPSGEGDDDQAHLLATKLPVWANDDELEIQALRALMKLL